MIWAVVAGDRVVGDVIACIEHVECGAPIEIRGCGFAGNGESGVLADKVTE